jgi:hypothetical protein
MGVPYNPEDKVHMTWTKCWRLSTKKIWRHIQEILKYTVLLFGLHVKHGKIFTITNRI